jgi:hypothetical protein
MQGTSRFNVDDGEDRDDDNGDHNCDLDHFNADKSADTIASPCLIVTWLANLTLKHILFLFFLFLLIIGLTH